MYTPPFSISPQAINLIAKISAMIERYAIRLEQSDGLLLRKVNRIKTIHSSLAIEGNSLSEDSVRDIINGKKVVAPLREIQEVRNAIKTYDLYSTFNPFEVNDLLKAHGVMMEALATDAGKFRHSGVGVFSDKGLEHMAPPAKRVPLLVQDLFEWLKSSNDHLLVRSCIFHYEFEFIHPFTDGNGRIGRLWQSLILGKLHPLFEHLPVENMVYSNQEAYYHAISQSTQAADCGYFIDFMLQEIFNAIKQHQEEPIQTNDVGINVGINVGIKNDLKRSILVLIDHNPRISAKEMALSLGISSRQCERIIAELKNSGILKREGANKNGQWIIQNK